MRDNWPRSLCAFGGGGCDSPADNFLSPCGHRWGFSIAFERFPVLVAALTIVVQLAGFPVGTANPKDLIIVESLGVR